MKIVFGTLLITTILMTSANIAPADDSVPVLAPPPQAADNMNNTGSTDASQPQKRGAYSPGLPSSLLPASPPASPLVIQETNPGASPDAANTSNTQNNDQSVTPNASVPQAAGSSLLPSNGSEASGNVPAVIGNTASSPVPSLPAEAAPSGDTPMGQPSDAPNTSKPSLSLPPLDKPAEPTAAVPKKTAAITASADEGTKTGETAGKKHKKKKGRHKKKQVQLAEKPQLPIHYDIKDRLPEEIYKKSYDKLNRHLPVAYYELDYDKLVFLTAERDDLNGLRSLILAGRNINIVNAAGETPLIVAVRNGSINTALLLVEHNAEVNITDGRGLTPLEIASANGDQRMVNILNGIE